MSARASKLAPGGVINLSDDWMPPSMMQVLNAGVRFVPSFFIPPREVNGVIKDTINGISEQLARFWTFQDWEAKGWKITPKFLYNGFWDLHTVHIPKPYLPRIDWQNLDRSSIIKRLSSRLPTLLYAAWSTPASRNNLTMEEWNALGNLRKDTQHVYIKADKDRAIVRMPATRYFLEGMKHLGDTKVYQPVNRHQLGSLLIGLRAKLEWCLDYAVQIKFQARGNSIGDYIRNSFPTKEDIIQWRDSNEDVLLGKFGNRWRFPRFRLLVKTHKAGNPTRPIAGAHSWISSQISTMLTKILHPLVVQHIFTIVKDTDSLLDKIRPIQKLLWNPRVVTLDVAAMYPNIPVVEGTNCVKEFLELLHVPGEMVTTVTTLLRIVLDSMVVQFGDLWFRQISGTAMGTNVAPDYANIVMFMVERKFLQHKGILLVESNFRPTPNEITWYTFNNSSPFFYVRYLDDVLLIGEDSPLLSNRQECENMMKGLTALRFDGYGTGLEVPYLDVMFTTYSNQLEWKPYRKPSTSGLYLPPFSNHPTHTIRNWIKGELSRLTKRSSDGKVINSAHHEFIDLLLSRGYSQGLLENVIREWINSHFNQPERKKRHIDDTMFIPIEYNKNTMFAPRIEDIIHGAIHLGDVFHSVNMASLLPQISTAWKKGRNLENRLFPSHATVALARSRVTV